MIPIVCRQTPIREFCCGGGILSEPVRDLCDHEESVDLLTACECSERKVGTGKTRLSAETGARDGLIATLSFSKMNVESSCSASGSPSLPECSHRRTPTPGHVVKNNHNVSSSTVTCDPSKVLTDLA